MLSIVSFGVADGWLASLLSEELVSVTLESVPEEALVSEDSAVLQAAIAEQKMQTASAADIGFLKLIICVFASRIGIMPLL